VNFLKTNLLTDLLLQQQLNFGRVLAQTSRHAEQLLGNWEGGLRSALNELNRQTNDDVLIGSGPNAQALAILNRAQIAAGKKVLLTEEQILKRLPAITPSPKVLAFHSYDDEQWIEVRKTFKEDNDDQLYNIAFNDMQLIASRLEVTSRLNRHRIIGDVLQSWGELAEKFGVHDQPLDLIKFDGNEKPGLYPGVNIDMVRDDMGGVEETHFLLLPVISDNRSFLLATRKEVRFLTWVELEQIWSLHNRHEVVNHAHVAQAVSAWAGSYVDGKDLQAMLRSLRARFDQVLPMSADDWCGELKRANAFVGEPFVVSEHDNNICLVSRRVELRLSMEPVGESPDGPTLKLKEGGLALHMVRPADQQARIPQWSDLTNLTQQEVADTLGKLTEQFLQNQLEANNVVAQPQKTTKAKKAAPVAKKAVKKAAPRKGR